MPFSYNPLWEILIRKNWTKEKFRTEIHASPSTIAAMGKGEGISPKVLARICERLNITDISKIMYYIPDGYVDGIKVNPPDSYEEDESQSKNT